MKLAGEIVDCRFGSELDVARVRASIAAVDPGAYEQSYRGLLGLCEARVILERAPGIGVVPAADVQHRDVGSSGIVLAPVDT